MVDQFSSQNTFISIYIFIVSRIVTHLLMLMSYKPMLRSFSDRDQFMDNDVSYITRSRLYPEGGMSQELTLAMSTSVLALSFSFL